MCATTVANAAAFEVQVHVAHAGSDPVASADWLAAQWNAARELNGPALAFAPRSVANEPIPRSLESRADRNALAKWAVPHALNVFVVESLADVDEPGRQRLGVHWRAGGTHYVIVATYAVPNGVPCPPQYRCENATGLLAHELGHFFGLAHDPRPDNVMSYERAGGTLWFDEPQRRRLAARRDAELAAGLRLAKP